MNASTDGAFAVGATFRHIVQNRQDRHLWFVVRKIVVELGVPASVVVANATTWHGTGHEDASCTFGPDEHPYLVNRSYVPYQYVDVLDAKRQGELIALAQQPSPTVEFYEQKMSRALIEAVIQGAEKTPHLSPVKYEWITGRQRRR